MVERTDDHPGAGSATYCSADSWRQASRTLVLAQRSYANNATTSSCMRISPGLGQGHGRYCRADNTRFPCCNDRNHDAALVLTPLLMVATPAGAGNTTQPYHG